MKKKLEKQIDAMMEITLDAITKNKQLEPVLNELDTFNKLGYKAKINTHTTSYIN